MTTLTLEFTRDEYNNLREMVYNMEPENMTVEKYIYLQILRQMHLYLCGRVAGMDQVSRMICPPMKPTPENTTPVSTENRIQVQTETKIDDLS